MVYKKSHFSILKQMWKMYNMTIAKAKELCNVHYAQLRHLKIVDFAKIRFLPMRLPFRTILKPNNYEKGELP